MTRGGIGRQKTRLTIFLDKNSEATDRYYEKVVTAFLNFDCENGDSSKLIQEITENTPMLEDNNMLQ